MGAKHEKTCSPFSPQTPQPRALRRLPAKLIRDVTVGGALHKILNALLEFRETKGLAQLTFSSSNREEARSLQCCTLLMRESLQNTVHNTEMIILWETQGLAALQHVHATLKARGHQHRLE